MQQSQYELFIEKVKKMREYQKEYFKTRSARELEVAKKLEREVDQLLKGETDKTQIKLFNA